MKPVRIPQDLVVQWGTQNPPPGGTLLVPDPFIDELMQHMNRIVGDEKPRARMPLVIGMESQWG
jgi:hypothetical protein